MIKIADSREDMLEPKNMISYFNKWAKSWVLTEKQKV